MCGEYIALVRMNEIEKLIDNLGDDVGFFVLLIFLFIFYVVYKMFSGVDSIFSCHSSDKGLLKKAWCALV